MGHCWMMCFVFLLIRKMKGDEDEGKCDSGNDEKQNDDSEESYQDTLVDDFQVTELKILDFVK